jgi:hypothetical protein
MSLYYRFKYQLFLCTYLAHFVSCVSIGQSDRQHTAGIVQRITSFSNGNVSGLGSFSDTLTVWYKDSLVIEQVNRVNINTDEKNVKTVRNIPILFRYIDLRNRVLYDYRNFSDTAKIINKSILPDSTMNDYGWAFYSEKLHQIEGEPQSISDTVIESVRYKRIRFNFLHDIPRDGFLIGYFRCDDKGLMFSLEKAHSMKINCTMAKFVDYRYRNGYPTPYVSVEVQFLSDTLTANQLAIFDVWELNASKFGK